MPISRQKKGDTRQPLHNTEEEGNKSQPQGKNEEIGGTSKHLLVRMNNNGTQINLFVI